MNLQKRLESLQNALAAVTKKVYRFYRPASAKPPYIVWNESGEAGSLQADGKKVLQTVTVYVSYYTYTEYDDAIDEIQNALNSLGYYWELTSVQYGDPVVYAPKSAIHYMWTVKV